MANLHNHARGHTPPLLAPPRPRLLALLLLLLAAAPAVAAALLPPVAVGIGQLHFRDPRLDDLYGDCWAPAVILRGERWHGFHPALVVQIAFATREADPEGFVTATTTRLRFLPAAFQIPLEWNPHPAWALRAGPQVAWAWYREEWEARAAQQEVSASGHGTGGWLAGGGLVEVARDLGRAGTVTIGFDWLSAHAERGTLRGNPARETSMTGGWSAWRLAWRLPWLTPSEAHR